MQVKKLIAAAAMAGGMGAALSFGAGQAAADPHGWGFPPPPPGHVGQVVGVPPGQIGQWVGVPPGHWNKPWKWFN